MAKVVQLRGQRPGGWAKERWAWIGRVMADGDLSPIARLVGVSLAQGFANHETAECRPGLSSLMAAVAAPKRTVLRALADLQARGWIERKGGNAPGKLAAYLFRYPGQVPDLAHEQVPDLSPEQVPDLTRTGAKSCAPPRPPYMEEPQLNHTGTPPKAVHPRAALRPPKRPNIATRIVTPGSAEADAWNGWLAARGHPSLDQIGLRTEGGGWLMPVSAAPAEGNEVAYRIALGWAGWLRTR